MHILSTSAKGARLDRGTIDDQVAPGEARRERSGARAVSSLTFYEDDPFLLLLS